MPIYAYHGRDKDGRRVKGQIESFSEKAALEHLTAQGYLIAGLLKRRDRASFLFRAQLWSPVSTTDLLMFFLQLQNMLDAGVPLLTAIESSAQQSGRSSLRHIAADLAKRVTGGSSFSQALRSHSSVFDNLYADLIEVGEASGTLPESLRRVGELIESRDELNYQIKSALAYPIVLMVASVGVIAFAMVWLIPSFAVIFNRTGVPLPLPTRVMYGAGMWLKQNFILLIGVLLFMFVFLKGLLHFERFRYIWDRFWLRFPMIGTLIRRIETGRATRTFSSLLSSGVPMLTALVFVQRTTSNLFFQKGLKSAREAIERGERLTDAFRSESLFTSDVLQMVDTGEQSGSLDKMLLRVAVFYDQLIRRTLKSLTSVIEPFFIVLMGALVASIMLSVLLPIFDMIKIFKP